MKHEIIFIYGSFIYSSNNKTWMAQMQRKGYPLDQMMVANAK